MPSRIRSLPTLLTLLVLLAVLPGFATALVFADRQRQQALANVQSQNVAFLRLVSLNQSQIVANTKSVLKLLSASPTVRNGDLAGCQTLLDGVVSTTNRFDGLAVTDENRQLVCISSNVNASQTVALSNTVDAPRIGRTATVSDGNEGATRMYDRAVASKDFTIGEYFIGERTSRPYLGAVQPVLSDTGRLTGYVVAGLSLDALNASIESLRLPAGYVVAVLDRTGTFLVRWPPANLVGQNVADFPLTKQMLSESADGREHSATMTGVDGISRLYAYQGVPGTAGDLTVFVGIEPEIAYASIDNALRQYLAFLSLFTVLAAVIAWSFGNRRIVDPVRQIAESTQKIGSGNLSTRVQLTSESSELGMLAMNFNTMASQLEQNTQELNRRADALNVANSKLEQQVEQRTQQLQNTVNRLRESREQLRLLSAQQRRAVEDEQTRIAREVHDQIGQALTSLKLDVSSLRRRLGASHPEALALVAAKLAGMDTELDQTVNTARSISRSLRPTALDTLGLVAGIEVFAQEFEARTGIACSVNVEGDDQSLPPALATTAYRIMQEAMTNVVRHAQASEVNIHMSIDAEALEMRVQDNGAGIPAEKLNHFTSLGMLGMQERAHEFNGTLTVQSEVGKGTTIVTRLLRAGRADASL
jgi:signal transduction histidine kinase